MNFQLWLAVFSIPLEVQDHSVPQWKALRCGKYEPRGLSCGSTFNICQDVLKSANLIHKQGFVNSQMQTIANTIKNESLTLTSKVSQRLLVAKLSKRLKKVQF